MARQTAGNGEEIIPQIVRGNQAGVGLHGDILVKQPGLVDRSWPVSSARLGRHRPRADGTNGKPVNDNEDEQLKQQAAKAAADRFEGPEQNAGAGAGRQQERRRSLLVGPPEEREQEAQLAAQAQAQQQRKQAQKLEVRRSRSGRTKAQGGRTKARRLQETEPKPGRWRKRNGARLRKTSASRHWRRKSTRLPGRSWPTCRPRGRKYNKAVEQRLRELEQELVIAGTSASRR